MPFTCNEIYWVRAPLGPQNLINMKKKKSVLLKQTGEKIEMKKVDLNDPRIQERLKYLDEVHEQAEKRKRVPWWFWYQEITK